MPHGEHAKNIHQWLRSRVALIGSMLLAAFLFFQLIVIVQKSSATDRDIEVLREQQARLKDEQQQLAKLHTFLDTDYFAENIARAKLGYQKKGEVAVIITDDSQAVEPGQQDTEPQMTQPLTSASPGFSRTRLWWRYFFGE